ncbi:hypothetical protein BDV12DRAFT_96551 [Aspergillus spectabilis]
MSPLSETRAQRICTTKKDCQDKGNEKFVTYLIRSINVGWSALEVKNGEDKMEKIIQAQHHTERSSRGEGKEGKGEGKEKRERNEGNEDNSGGAKKKAQLRASCAAQGGWCLTDSSDRTHATV